MKNLTEKEWDIIKYSLSFLHNRDLSLFYDERTISTLENTMRKLDIDFVSQEEKDKKKIEKYVVADLNDNDLNDSVLTGCMIYCEPGSAKANVINYIENKM